VNKDLLSLVFQVVGSLGTALGRILAMKDEAAAKRALARLAAHGRTVDADAVALDAARSVPAPEKGE
jgi:hypothetical protein